MSALRGKPGTFAWWASFVAHVRSNRPFCTPEARRVLKHHLRASAVQAVLKGREWKSQDPYPAKSRHRGGLPWWLYARSLSLGPHTIVRHWVPGVVVRWVQTETGRRTLLVAKGTRTHTGCAAHMTRIERIWALYRRYPKSIIAQEMLVACANALRARGRVIPPMGGPPLSLQALRDTRNLELRRVLVEIQGVELPEKPFAEDAVGKLYQIDGQQALLEVKCPSTGRRYLLGVPVRSLATWNAPGVLLDTPSKAQRWTLGLGEEVQLAAQT